MALFNLYPTYSILNFFAVNFSGKWGFKPRPSGPKVSSFAWSFLSKAVPSVPCRSHSATLSPNHSGGGASGSGRPDFSLDEPDPPGSSEDSLTMTAKAIELIQSKIAKTKDLIRDEQTSRDNNVNEYLKLSANAERQQQNRIKQVWQLFKISSHTTYETI